MKLLVANGDSHTAGNEMDYECQPFCYEKAWPKVLSNMINIDNINLSRAGASNEYIFRTTQNWIIENVLIEKNFKPEDVIVMIMWSGFDRKEIYFEDTNIIDNINPMSIPEFYSTDMKKELKDVQKTLVYFSDNLTSDFKNLSIVYNMSMWLDLLGIEYRFINGLYRFPEINYLNSEYINHAYYQSYKNLLLSYGDKKISNHMGFSDFNQTFFGYMKDFSGIPTAPHSKFSHWGEDGHKHWAKKVYDFFFNKNQIVIKKLI